MRITPVLGFCFAFFSCSPDYTSTSNPFAFGGEPVHPGAIQMLVGTIADPLPVISSVDLEGWLRCNAHKASRTKADAIEWVDETGTVFGYRWIGVTSSGTHVLATYEYGGGGSGVWEHLIFVRIKRGTYRTADEVRECVYAVSVGGLFIGDREYPKLELTGNRVVMRPSNSPWRSLTEPVSYIVD